MPWQQLGGCHPSCRATHEEPSPAGSAECGIAVGYRFVDEEGEEELT